jgi:hypothetical protein
MVASSGQSVKRGPWLAVLLLSLALIRGLIYAALVPPWQAPDETGHFEYAWLIVQLGRLPNPQDVSPTFERELLALLYEWRYGEFIGRPLPAEMPSRMDELPTQVFARRSRTVRANRFSVAYLWPALFLLPFRAQDLAFQLFVARFSSILLNLGIVWLAYCTFEALLPSRPKIVASMSAVVVFLPQHTFINSMVGDGPLAELMACLVLYCWVCLFRRGLRAWQFAGIVLGTTIGISSKTTAAFLIPVDVGLALWWLMRGSRRTWTWRHATCVGLCTVLMGWGIWIWSRSSSGVRTLYYVRRLLSFPGLIWVDRRGITLVEALLLAYDSFWADFGWMTFRISERWYGAVALLSLAALIGWGSSRSGHDLPPWAVGVMSGAIFVAWAAFVWTALLGQESGYYQFQGRYLFPVIVPYAFLFVGGLVKLFPVRRQNYMMALLLLFLVFLDTWCLAGYILPYFYS